MYHLEYSNQAIKDLKKLKKTPYFSKATRIIDSLEKDPYAANEHFEFLDGDLKGCVSKRINIQHRIVYEVFEDRKVVRLIRLWTHYE